MTWLRRSAYVTFAYDADGEQWALSLLVGSAQRVSQADVEAYAGVPSREWVWRTDAHAHDLARRGLLVSDDPDPHLAELRRRDDELSTWVPQAAAFYLTTRWRGVDVDAPTIGRRLRESIESTPELPAAIYTIAEAKSVVELPDVRRESELYDVLTRRRTRRVFLKDGPLALDSFATILRYVWGAHGQTRAVGPYSSLRKTSASGGGLHPVEAYPLVIDVAGLAPGLYHYRVDTHALELLEQLTVEEARSAATTFTAGQTYFADASALVVMAARFDRNYWKYRRHAKALRVLLLDAGHLSQTFYLVCTQLGLGPFVTAALNEAEIEERLGLDPYRHGVLAVCGCGRPADVRSPLEREVLPLVPERVR